MIQPKYICFKLFNSEFDLGAEKATISLIMYQHQFIDPSQTNINYLDLSLMGSSGTSNNNSSCFEADPSSLFRMLQPSINFNDVGSYLNENMSISGTVSPTSAAVYYDPNAGFNYPLIPNNGIDINGHEHLLGFKGEGIDTYGGEVNENIMVKSGGKKRKNSGKGGVKNEKDRRLRLSKQYEVLKTVIPNPTKVILLTYLHCYSNCMNY